MSLQAAEKREIAAEVRQRVPDLVALYLFGSEARGDTHAASDLDLGLLTPAPMDPKRRWDLEQELSIALHRTVDLVDLLRAPTTLRMQVVTRGEVLADPHPIERQHYETWTFSAYARLNEERREILADIERRGTVHGR